MEATIYPSPTEKPIRDGMDLVVLQGDPLKDLRALSAVQYTLRAGKFIYRGT